MGVNHVALEVEDVEAALEFYGRIFQVRAVEREGPLAFIDLGDQFLTLLPGRRQDPDIERHFGLVVDDKKATRRRLAELRIDIVGPRLDFRDPSGNRIQVVDYHDIQFTKADSVLEGMGLGRPQKRPAALEELRDRGLG